MSEMVRTVLSLQASPGQADELVSTFKDLGVLDRHASAQEGFRGGELLRGEDDLVIVIAHWSSRETYGGWLDNPERDRINATLAPFLAGDPVGHVMEIEQAVPGA